MRHSRQASLVHSCRFFLIVVLLLLLVTGCGEKKVDEATIGVTIYRYDDMFMSTFEKEIKLQAEEKVVLNLNDAGNSQTTQNDQIKSLTAKKVDVLAINLVDINTAEQVVEKYNKRDIPIIFFNREPAGEVIASNEHCWYIGTDSKEAGILQAQIILEGWLKHPEWDKNGDGVIQYVMLMGERDHQDTLLRSEYVIKTIESTGIKTLALNKAFADWDSLKAKELMDQWSHMYEDQIELVISNNDAMAIGAIVSLQNDGYLTKERFIPVIGVDGIPEFLNKIQNGLAIGTVINDAKGQSEALIDLSINIINDSEMSGDYEWEGPEQRVLRIPYIPISTDNIDAYLENN